MSASERAPTKPKTEGAVSLRIRPDDRALIDRAARAAGTSRSEFMLAASRRAAEEAIMDQTLFRLDPGAFDAFVRLLDAPPAPNDRLLKTMTTPPPWR
jgi:uncharacterized protein (DUF1778 family)